MSQIIDVLDFRPDRIEVCPHHEWRIFSMGVAKRSGIQARYCAPNCEHYLRDKDDKCGRFWECDHFIFDMHRIATGDPMVLVLFATEMDPPHDGVSWLVHEKQLVEVMGTRPSGKVDLELGRKIVDTMIQEYNLLRTPQPVRVTID